MLAQEGHQGVARLVVSGMALLLVGHEERPALGTHAQFVSGFLEVEHCHFLVVEPCSEEGGFVHQVFEVCTGKSRRALCYSLHIDIVAKRDLAFFQVNA